MAGTVEVDSWDGQGVHLSDVLDALGVLRQRAREHTSARTAVMTMVAVVGTDEQTETATATLRSLGGNHPARILLLRPDPDGVAALDAHVALHSANTETHPINFEEVHLNVGGQAAKHLDSIVEPFTLADLPVAVWYVGAVPDAADPLLSVANSVLLDSRDAEGQLRGLLELARRRAVVDLSWIRLRPWRRLLAALFDPPEYRPWLGAVESVEVKGKIGPRQLLGGWLAAQLDLRPRQVTLLDARHVEIVVSCRREGVEASFEVVRGDAHRTVAAQAVVGGQTGRAHGYPLAADPLTSALADALTRLGPDVVWERALSTATTLLV